ncbi:MAG: ParB/RepB/Spo0J family partition protein [Alphaproteobacteria bacterium]
MSNAENPGDGGSASAEALSSEAEAAARSAAAAAGLPLSAWISQAIRGTAPRAPDAAKGPEGEAPSLKNWAREVAVGLLSPGRFQTRERIRPEEIDALAESIRAHGVLQPILVRRRPGSAEAYEIIAGERRWRASRQAGLADVPVVVLGLSDEDAMEVAIIENLQRQDLGPLEEAEGYRRLLEDYSRTQDDVARVAGKSRSHISNTMRLMKLPDSVKQLLTDGELSAGHARALLNTPDAEAAARVVVARGYNVRQTENFTAKAAQGIMDRSAPAPKDRDLVALEQELTALLGLKCRITYREDRGSVQIRFKELSSLGQLIARLQRTQSH